MPVIQHAKRVGIVVVAYNAASTLAQVLDWTHRDIRPRISKVVIVCDDSEQGLDVPRQVSSLRTQVTDDLPLTVVRHPHNLGYGGNQKAGYRLAIEKGPRHGRCLATWGRPVRARVPAGEGRGPARARRMRTRSWALA